MLAVIGGGNMSVEENRERERDTMAAMLLSTG